MTTQLIVTFNKNECLYCHAVFALTNETEYRLRATHEDFYCPLCSKSMVYKGESDMERERRLRNAAESLASSRLAQLDQAQAAAADEKKKRERLQRRVHAGLCPHCKRSFSQLKQHIAAKHGRSKKP